MIKEFLVFECDTSARPCVLRLLLLTSLLLLQLLKHHLLVLVAALETVQLILIAGDVRFATAPRLYALRNLPHGVLVQVVFKVVEKADDFLVLLELVRPVRGRENLLKCYYFAFKQTYPFLKRFMFTTMWYCCQRLEKFIEPSCSVSGLPMWTNVRSCSTRPLLQRKSWGKWVFFI